MMYQNLRFPVFFPFANCVGMNPLSAPTTVQGPIQLVLEGPHVAVAQEDQKRFTKEALRAMSDCCNGLEAKNFWELFQDQFLATIHHWCRQHADRVTACYVPFPRDHLEVFVVSRAEAYDFSLSDDLAGLEMDLFERNWPSDINQVPRGSRSDLESFFDPTASIQVYGDTG